jgi:hypothetical protein
MAFIPVADCAEAHLIFDYQGQICQNVFHSVRGVPYTEEDLMSVAEVYSLWWLDQLGPYVPSTVKLVRIEVLALDSEGAPGVVYNAGLPATGEGSPTNQLPNNVTFAVKWSTGLRGRSYRGRTYHIGMSKEITDGNVLKSADLVAYTARYTALMGALGENGDIMCVVSRFHNNLPRSAGLVSDITACTIDPTLDSMRRRLPGRGT